MEFVIEQHQGAADRLTRQQIARFVLLERARAAADHLARLGLTEPQLLTDRVTPPGGVALTKPLLFDAHNQNRLTFCGFVANIWPIGGASC